MANYTRTQNFTVKDSLDTGDAEKIISGADMDGELNAIATAIATKTESSFESGTKMVFVGTAAPTGWTLVTTYDDRVLVVQNSATESTAGNWTISGTELTLASSGNLPNHTHTLSHTHSIGNHVHAINNHTHSAGNYKITLTNGINVGGGGQYGSNTSSIDVSGNSGNPNSLPNTDNPASGNTGNANTNTTSNPSSESLSVSTVVNGGTMVNGNYRPAYVNTFICSKN